MVYWLCGLLLLAPNCLPGESGGAFPQSLAKIFPLFVALLFVAHPIQTESVTYLWQRNTSLAAMFYLLSMALYMKSALTRDGPGRRSTCFLAGALLFGFAATITKQIAVTLPVAIVLMEYFFISPSIEKLKSKIIRLSLFIPVLLVIPAMTALGLGNELTDMAVRQDNVLGPFEYLSTQFNVIVMYIKLLFIPVGLNLDYDYPAALSFSDWFLSFTILIALVGLSFWLFKRDRIASFGILFFFLSICVESSFFPLEDIVFEHRTYLPSVGFFMAVTAILFGLIGRIQGAHALKVAAFALVVWVSALAVMTMERNAIWSRDVLLWRDVIQKSPKKIRGYLNLGYAYMAEKNYKEAEVWFGKSLEMDNHSTDALYNLSEIYDKRGELEKAINTMHKAVKAKPGSNSLKYALGNLYFRNGIYSKAAKYYRMGLALETEFNEDALHGFGSALAMNDRTDDAIKVYKLLVRQRPGNRLYSANLEA
ncbi:hypothetical protein MNBD_NITROSPINAE03-714, partial [hydrothermal vent metagenome]